MSIVGGGTSGAVVANRLSADPRNRVLVLEWGGDPNPLTTIPGIDPMRPSTTHTYTTVPQKGTLLLEKGVSNIVEV